MYETHQSESTTARALRTATAVQYPALAVRHRIPLMLIVLFVACLCSFAVLLYLSSRLETKIAGSTVGEVRIKAINQQVEALQQRFGALLADSVEMRLKALQSKIEKGMVSSADLAAFDQLKNDLMLLQGYAAAGGADALDSTAVEHARFRRLPDSGAARNQELLDEVLYVKNLLYFCAASLATTAVLISGYWLGQRSRLHRIGSEITGVPMLAKRRGAESGD